jgi:hypothetical protein
MIVPKPVNVTSSKITPGEGFECPVTALSVGSEPTEGDPGFLEDLIRDQRREKDAADVRSYT